MSRLYHSHSLLDAFKRRIAEINIDLSSTVLTNKTVLNDQLQRFKYNNLHQSCLENLASIEHAVNLYNENLKELSNKINTDLRKVEQQIIQRDYDRTENSNEDIEYVHRNSYLSTDIIEKCQAVIRYYTTWQHASLEVNPGDGVFSIEMNAAEPQYCIVQNKDVEAAVKSKFNDFYARRRLRIYSSITDVPESCAGIATCINLFEYLPLDPIKDIAKQVITCLKPGGVFLSTYNNCEQRRSLEMLDNEFRCLNTKEIMSNLLYGVGFDIVDTGSVNDGAWSYIIVKKPGDLFSEKLSSPQVGFITIYVPYADWPSELQELVEAKKSRSSVQWRGDVMAYYQPAWNNLKPSVHKYIDEFYLIK